MMRIGFWFISSYTLRLGGGICLSFIWLWYATPLFNIKRQDLAQWIWILGLSVIACGRLGYGLIHSAYFLQNPAHLWQLHRFGGVHGESALFGGLVVLGIWAVSIHRKSSTHYDQSFLRLLALFAPAILSTAAGAWWACMKVGCAWGRSVNQTDMHIRFLLLNGPDLYHTVRLRYPVQLIGAIGASLMAGASVIHSHRSYHGALVIILYLLGAASLTLLRGDSIPTIEPVRMDTIENLGLALILGGIRLRYMWRSRSAS